MRLNHILRTTASAAVVGAAVFGAAGVASAQEQEVTRVDDIIVTAQKREQSLQDVPIVVTTLSQETLENAGVRDIKDLQILTPGMTVTSTASEGSTTARIRGVGTVGDNPGLESSVGIVIDGVYRSRNSVGFGDLGELQRIEVLKGPQGTLFGKNTSAGVINIITEQPSFTPEFNFEATVGNYDAKAVSGSVSGPLSDTLAFRLYAGRRLRDGFMNIDTGDGPRAQTDDNNQDFGTVRGQLLWLPTESTSIRIIADYSKRDEYCCVGTQVRTGPTGALVDLLSTGAGVRPAAPGFGRLPIDRIAYANRSTEQQIEDKGVSIELNTDLGLFGGSTFTSITAYRDWEFVNGQDADFSGADVAYRLPDGEFGAQLDNFTQEFRLAGATDRLDWLVGVFASVEGIERRDSFYLGADYAPLLSLQITSSLGLPPNPGRLPCFTVTGQTSAGLLGCLATGVGATGPTITSGQALRDVYEQDSDTFAVFTNSTYRITDSLDVTLGLRFTQDEKSLSGLQTNLGTSSAACAAILPNAGIIGPAVVLGGGSPAQAAEATNAIVGRFCLPWTNPFYANRAINESTDDSEISGTFKVGYRPMDDLLLYASYARGYKSFGYNQDRVQSGVTPVSTLFFPSETVDAYEAGFKSTLLDGSLLLNATYFHQTFNDFQLNTFLGTAFVVESIPELKSQGVDADLLWLSPVEGLTFQAGVTYTDAKYGQFTAADLSAGSNFAQLSLLPGARASFAPEWSVTGGVTFDRSLGNGLRGGFSLSGKWMSEYNTGSDLLPFKMQDDFAVLNGRVTLGTEDDRWTVEFWGQNLTDEEYTQVAYNAFLQGDAFPQKLTPQADGTFYNPATDSLTYDAFLGAPRTYGMTLRYRY